MAGVRNPYVGPTPFKAGQPLFGRDREVAELRYLLTAERIVLLYSPSGAGKSSLVQAGLIPKVLDRFDIWGPARVNAQPPEGMGHNRYVWSAIASLEKSETHGFTNLKEYAAQRPRKRSPLLIIDQFEEVLRVDPNDTDAKRAFFAQLGDLLSDPGIWALLVLREDYLAPLDPFVGFIPSHLQNRFRIDRLTTESAILAVEGPAALTERCYAEGVVKKLVENLATVQVQLPDGRMEPRVGPYVEPLQLQVVCFDLWERQQPEDMVVDPEDVGDIGDALRNYYDHAVSATADRDDKLERAIREWFQKQLITADGVRNQVRHETRSSGGLDNARVERLLETYLIRAEPRSGTSWYELAHDRLVRPILESNKDWFDAHLSKVQKVAAVWEAEGRPGLLLIGEELAEGQRWASAQTSLTEGEQDFLAASAERQGTVNKERRQARRILGLAIVSTVVSVLALFAFLFAIISLLEAVDAREAANMQHLLGAWQSAARQASNELANHTDDDRGALLALQSLLLYVKTPNQPRYLVESALQDAIAQTVVGHVFYGHEGYVNSVAFAPGGDRLASASGDSTVRVWNLREPSAPPLVLSGHEDAVISVAFAPDGNRLASAGSDKTVRLWDLQQPSAPPLVFSGHEDAVNSVAFAPDGSRLASAGSDKTVRLWDLRQPSTPPLVFSGHEDAVNSVAFAPGGNRFASASADKTVRLWDLRRPSVLPLVFSGHENAVTSAAFSPDGNRLASASFDGKLRVWDLRRPSAPPLAGLGMGGFALASVAFAPDGNRLASASFDGQLRVWDLRQPDAGLEQLPGHDDGVKSVAFSPDGQRLASASFDKTVRVWDLKPSAARLVLSGHEDAVPSVAFAPDGNRLASAGNDKTVRVWDLGQPDAAALVLSGHEDAVNSVAFAPDGNRLASASADKTVRVWNLSEPSAPPLVLSGHEGPVTSVSFAPGGNRLASTSTDQLVRLWDLDQPSVPPLLLEGHENLILSIAFAPDGNRLASASADETIRVWDLGQPTASPLVLSGHRGVVHSVAFAPDGNRLASASEDSAIRVWDLGRPTARPVFLSGHAGAATSVVFSPDGNRLASAGVDKTVRVWPLWTTAADYLCTRVWRNLSMEEWKLYIGESIIDYESTCPNLPPGVGAPGGPTG